MQLEMIREIYGLMHLMLQEQPSTQISLNIEIAASPERTWNYLEHGAEVEFTLCVGNTIGIVKVEELRRMVNESWPLLTMAKFLQHSSRCISMPKTYGEVLTSASSGDKAKEV